MRNIAANAALIVWLLIDVVRSYDQSAASEGLDRALWLFLATVLAYTAWVVSRRVAPVARHPSLRSTIFVIGGAFLPLAYVYVPFQDQNNWLATALQWSGAIGMALATVYLGSNFSMWPQLRRIVRRGPYAVIRHPLYASYLLFDLSWWLPSLHPLGGAIWVAEVVLLLFRAVEEEACLVGDESYLLYSTRVRFRLFPGLL